MTTQCDCFDGLVGFMRTGVMTLLSIFVYMVLAGIFSLKGIGDPGAAIIYCLMTLDGLALTFMGIFFCN